MCGANINGFVEIRMIIFEGVNISQMKVFSWLASVSISLCLLYSCSHNPLDVSTDGVSLSLRQTNLDSLITKTDSSELLNTLMKERVRIPDIIDYQITYCLGAGMVTDPNMVSNLQRFIHEPYVQRLEKRIHQKFPSPAKHTAAIRDGLIHLKAHFPNGTFPKEIVYLNSYFTSSIYCTDHEIAVGLERYLGEKTDVIAELPSQDFFPWIKAKFDPKYIERDAVAAWTMTHFVKMKENVTTIEAIINWGKVIYLTEAAFPDKPKSWIMRYSESQYNWALENERNFWDFLVEEKMLFKTDERTQANLLNDGPFTTGLPEKGPDRLGQFLGWRIIHSYMEQYDITLQELMQLPYTTLLQEYEISE